MKRIFGFLASLTFFSCSHQTVQNMNQDKKHEILSEVRSMLDRLTLFSETAQTDSFLSYYENYPDFIQIAGDGKMRDYGGFKKICTDYYETLKEQKVSVVEKKMQVLDTNLVVSAWTVNILAHFKNGDIMRMDNYSITYLIKKIGEQWKIIHTHESSLPPELIKNS